MMKQATEGKILAGEIEAEFRFVNARFTEGGDARITGSDSCDD
jgi:hypothetical protein